MLKSYSVVNNFVGHLMLGTVIELKCVFRQRPVVRALKSLANKQNGVCSVVIRSVIV
jgi:hypothetical protein